MCVGMVSRVIAELKAIKEWLLWVWSTSALAFFTPGRERVGELRSKGAHWGQLPGSQGKVGDGLPSGAAFKGASG